jgi:hypothetical protein
LTFEAPANDTPFNNPSAQPALVEMWRSAIKKAHQEIPPAPVLPSVILANFDGVGLPLTVGMAAFAEVTFPCKLLSCHIYAGVANVTTGIQPVNCSASVELRIAAQGQWSSGSRTVYSGTRPTLTGAAEADVNITGWVTSFQPGDVLTYVLSSFTGAATVLTISLPVRRLDVVGVGSQALRDGAGSVILGTEFTTSGGDPFVLRS